MPLLSAAAVQWLLDRLPVFEEGIRSGRYAMHFLFEEADVRSVAMAAEYSAEREFADVNMTDGHERLLKWTKGMG